MYMRVFAWDIKMSTKFEEVLWIQVRISNNEEIVMGCVYKSPQNTKENNALLRNILVETYSG